MALALAVLPGVSGRAESKPHCDYDVVLLDEDYRMRGGYLGHLLDIGYLGPTAEKGRSAALANLKRLIETGNEILFP